MLEDVRAIERWGLVSGVTGVVANGLLVTLYTVALPGNEKFDWTGPANDVIGAVSAGAMIPVAWATYRLLGRGRTLRVTTVLATCAMGSIVVLSILLVSGVVPFAVQGAGAGIAVLFWFAWLYLVGRRGLQTGRLPRRLARAAKLIGGAVPLAAPLVGLSFLFPAKSIPQYALRGAGLAIGVPAFLAYPIWLLMLSNRLRAHLTDGTASVEAMTRSTDG
jgi:hypothetical protein